VVERCKAWVYGRSLLGLWVRMPSSVWMFVRCVLSSRGLFVGLPVRRSPTECDVSVIVNLRQCGGLGPLGAVARYEIWQINVGPKRCITEVLNTRGFGHFQALTPSYLAGLTIHRTELNTASFRIYNWSRDLRSKKYEWRSNMRFVFDWSVPKSCNLGQ
jgi:hypothetical protein